MKLLEKPVLDSFENKSSQILFQISALWCQWLINKNFYHFLEYIDDNFDINNFL